MTDTTNRWNRWLARAKALGDPAGRAKPVADLLAEVDDKVTAVKETQERSRDTAITQTDVHNLRAGQERFDELIGDLATRVVDLQAAMDVAHAEMRQLAERLDAGFSFDVDLGLDEDRQQVIGAVTSIGQDLKGQIDELRSDIDQLVPRDGHDPPTPVTAEMLADLRDELLNELVVLRRRVKVRADDGALSDEQVDAIADAVAQRLGDRGASEENRRSGSLRASTRRSAPLSANGPAARSETRS